MGNKINVSELLKNCPQGMELDCVMYEDVYFDHVDELNIIHCYIKNKGFKTSITFNQHGTPNSDIKSKCVIFPKGKTTWEGFQKPFKDGDVLVHTQNDRFVMSIYKSNESETIINTYTIFWDRGEGLSVGMQICCYTDSTRLATEEEKQKLFNVIKENGYRWNTESKTLEKLPKFKVGDRITNGKTCITISYIDNEYYYEISRNIANRLFIKNQDEWNLVPNKFDINTLKPFESKVLVRSIDKGLWKPAIYGFSHPNGCYVVGGACWKQCIPYEGNEHLRGTTDSCDDYFKTWKDE